MARTTPETLLISAIVNSNDPSLGEAYGLRPEHFTGYRNEYEWVLTHYKHYGTCPTGSQLTTAFRAFPYSADHASAGWPAREIRTKHDRHKMQVRLREATMALDRDDVEGAYKLFENCKMNVVAPKPGNALIDYGFLDDYEDVHEPRIPMPWDSLQTRTNGIGAGELWYYAARQGHGKSSFLLDMAAEAAVNGRNVVFYSLEMTRRQAQVRLHAALGRRLNQKVDANAMLRRTWPHADYKHLLQRIEAEVPGGVHIHEMSMGLVTPALVNSHANDFDLSVIDYVGLMRNDEGLPAIKDYRIIAEISNGLKATCLAKYHPIIAASQINREGVSERQWRPPKLHTLAQSDHLGNDGDVVITMKRFGLGAAVSSIEKNRHGASGEVYFNKFNANHGDFSEITRDEADDIKSSEDDRE